MPASASKPPSLASAIGKVVKCQFLRVRHRRRTVCNRPKLCWSSDRLRMTGFKIGRLPPPWPRGMASCQRGGSVKSGLHSSGSLRCNFDDAKVAAAFAIISPSTSILASAKASARPSFAGTARTSNHWPIRPIERKSTDRLTVKAEDRSICITQASPIAYPRVPRSSRREAARAHCYAQQRSSTRG